MPAPQGVTARVSGIPNVKARLRRLGDAAEREFGNALWRRGVKLMTKIKTEQRVPVDRGMLRKSGHVELPERRKGVVVVEVGFGGPAGSGNHGGDSNEETVGYAVYVHEDLTAHHDVGAAKYLTEPAMEEMPKWPREIAADLDAALERVA